MILQQPASALPNPYHYEGFQTSNLQEQQQSSAMLLGTSRGSQGASATGGPQFYSDASNNSNDSATLSRIPKRQRLLEPDPSLDCWGSTTSTPVVIATTSPITEAREAHQNQRQRKVPPWQVPKQKPPWASSPVHSVDAANKIPTTSTTITRTAINRATPVDPYQNVYKQHQQQHSVSALSSSVTGVTTTTTADNPRSTPWSRSNGVVDTNSKNNTATNTFQSILGRLVKNNNTTTTRTTNGKIVIVCSFNNSTNVVVRTASFILRRNDVYDCKLLYMMCLLLGNESEHQQPLTEEEFKLGNNASLRRTKFIRRPLRYLCSRKFCRSPLKTSHVLSGVPHIGPPAPKAL